MTLGILGGGQLAQMLALAAIPLGIRCHVYDPSGDAPAALVAAHTIAQYTDTPSLEAFANSVDVITYEFENVPAATAQFLSRIRPLYPIASALAIGQDRLHEKQFFGDLGFTTAPFAAIDNVISIHDAIAHTKLPAIIKTRRNGYDGKGQQWITTLAQAQQTMDEMAGNDVLVEGVVQFTREVSLLVVRDRFGTIYRYPLVENHHHAGILRVSIAPAANIHPQVDALADAIARQTVAALDYVGLLAIECFEVMTANGPTLIINEMAPRVHNSGHWTIEGAGTSQFENHVRAVCGLTIGPADARGMSAMMNLIGAIPDISQIPAGVHVHLYYKTPRPGRKVGHLTIVAADMATLMATIETCRHLDGVWLPPIQRIVPKPNSSTPSQPTNSSEHK